MKDLLAIYENKQPEIVFHWKDTETEAEGWTVINSLRGGAAGGGTRMREGLDVNEVLSLAKTMEVKFTVSGPPIGGAKSGINFNPKDPRKKGVLERWYHAVAPLLKSYYGTGGDLNVDEIHEVIPITEDAGVWHPQEGVFNGHFKPTEADKINRIGQLRLGVIKVLEGDNYSPDVSRKYTVADMITGFGVAEAVKHFYDISGGSVTGKRAIVQGFGNVGAAAAFYLAKMGAKVVGIIDRVGGVIKEEGFTFEEIVNLYKNKDGNTLVSEDMIPFEEINERIWNLKTEIFAPCAASRLVTKDQISRMIDTGLEVISCGANVPFADKEIFFGPIMEFTDERVSLIPDFISNCGMARVFAFFMEGRVSMDDELIFTDTSTTIRNAILNIFDQNSTKTNLSKTAFEIALKQLI
ncbi:MULTISPECIES: Glu/Leu/Phe/Val dehydrogenase dimerization domain-containing protein [Cellulophaga]|uniref:Amino acid dehydrogenase n=1 Tax=Cellulophaga baltica 18 TaxID=1348584 RepID=A0AAU8RHL8_9FLAO|nr:MULTISPECIES: Glu/Leu/Phe/Val dehydrogenase dimerization domain-containing protein [Cellulophaga]WFO15582.1 amino acid dehydrogenase [Cellulophaga baltica 4]AIY12043.1 amino acid dehydrogenase [Cellulophaga baltica NN016038]AIZ40413.1 amino acid dehydrogenase [Cellulophaga baltica 18]KGK29469.1 amino acid dehydrogenase [Cellulophaga sp. E6(2014)]MBA6314145.1 amino acid dehydrogenase [Cellulophaga baltica]